MERINIFENGIYMTLEITDKEQLKLLHFGAEPFDESKIKAKSYDCAFNLTEISLSGSDRPYERHGTKYIVTAPGYRMKYVSRSDSRNEQGRVLEFVTRDEETEVYVTVKIQFFDGISVAGFVTEVENRGAEPQTLEYVSLFNYTGFEKEGILPRDEKIIVINKQPTKAGFNLFLPKPPINTLDKLAIILPIITNHIGVLIGIIRDKNTPGIIA